MFTPGVLELLLGTVCLIFILELLLNPMPSSQSHKSYLFQGGESSLAPSQDENCRYEEVLLPGDASDSKSEA